MDDLGGRTVTLVLVSPAGEVLGALPPFPVATPWWQEVSGLATEGRQVLRLLHGDRPAPPGGNVTYLAEISGDAPAGLTPVEADLAPHPRRAAYAEVGGPAASVSWARGELGGPAVTAHQQRTWNLSAIWRLDGRDGRPVAWLKQVPSFFAHEPAVIRLVDSVAPGLVPPLIAEGGSGRMLLAHVPGTDRYGAGADVCEAIAEAFHPVQVELARRVTPGPPYLAADLGPDIVEMAGGRAWETGAAVAIPDGRIDVERIARVAEPHLGEIEGLGELIDDLPRRLAEVAECGLPDTLVHGDLHPGNARTDDRGRLTIMDWGDCLIGNPAFDILRLTERLDDPDPVLHAWAYRWRKARPGTRPERAAELLRPVAALRSAVVYADFVASIEPSEWPYHAADVPACLAASIVKG